MGMGNEWLDWWDVIWGEICYGFLKSENRLGNLGAEFKLERMG